MRYKMDDYHGEDTQYKLFGVDRSYDPLLYFFYDLVKQCLRVWSIFILKKSLK